MYRKSKSINLEKIYIRFTYFMFYLVKVSPIARVTSQAYHQYGVASCPAWKITKEDALDTQPQGIKLTRCLPMVGGSLRVLRLLPPLKLVAMI